MKVTAARTPAGYLKSPGTGDHVFGPVSKQVSLLSARSTVPLTPPSSLIVRFIRREGAREAGRRVPRGRRGWEQGEQASDGEVTGEPPVTSVSAVPAQRSYPG